MCVHIYKKNWHHLELVSEFFKKEKEIKMRAEKFITICLIFTVHHRSCQQLSSFLLPNIQNCYVNHGECIKNWEIKDKVDTSIYKYTYTIYLHNIYTYKRALWCGPTLSLIYTNYANDVLKIIYTCENLTLWPRRLD